MTNQDQRLGRLNLRDRQVLNLMRQGVQTPAEIARRLAVPRGRVYTTVGRLRDIFGSGLSYQRLIEAAADAGFVFDEPASETVDK